jgi:hypothetical protein
MRHEKGKRMLHHTVDQYRRKVAAASLVPCPTCHKPCKRHSIRNPLWARCSNPECHMTDFRIVDQQQVKEIVRVLKEELDMSPYFKAAKRLKDMGVTSEMFWTFEKVQDSQVGLLSDAWKTKVYNALRDLELGMKAPKTGDVGS